MLTLSLKKKTADWICKRFKLLKRFKQIRVLKLFLYSRLFLKKKIKKKDLWYNYVFFQYKFYNLKYVYFLLEKKKTYSLFKLAIKYLAKYSGLYLKFWHFSKKFKYFLKKLKKKNFFILRFIFGPQQIRFVLNVDTFNKQETHATVGSLFRLKLNVEANAGSYKHITEADEALKIIQKKRTKKWISFFKDETGLNSFKNVFLKKKIFSAKKSKKRLEQRQELEKSIKLTLQKKKKKFTDDSVLYNLRRNPRTDPILFKKNRRNIGTWLWFLRMTVLFLKKKSIIPKKKIILHICGFKKVYGLCLNFLIKILKKYKIILLVYKLKINFNKEKIKPITDIKRKRRKRIIKSEGVLETLIRDRAF